MNKRNRSFLTILLCFIFLLNISPLSMFKPIRVMAADQLSLKVKDIEYYPGKGCGGFQNLNPSFGINYGEDGDVTCNGGTVTIEQNFDSLKDSFFYEDFLYGIRVSYNPATGVVTLTGKKPIHYYEMFMQGMMFKTTAESGSRKIIVSLNTDKLTVKAAINVSIIDETPPIVSVLGNPTTWTKGDVTLNVDAFDAIPGLDPKGAYSFDGGSSWTTSNSKSFSSNGIINIIVRDKAGNKAYKNVDINKIDKTAPTFSNITQTPTDWTTGVNLIVNKATDVGSGLHSTPYSFSTTQAGYYWQASNVSSAYSKNQTVYVYVMDALGNISNASTVDITKIDTTKPTVSTNDTNYSWRNKDFNVTIDYSDTGGSKVNTKEYAVTNSSETPSAWTSSEASKLISISSEGQWYIHYKEIGRAHV